MVSLFLSNHQSLQRSFGQNTLFGAPLRELCPGIRRGIRCSVRWSHPSGTAESHVAMVSEHPGHTTISSKGPPGGRCRPDDRLLCLGMRREHRLGPSDGADGGTAAPIARPSPWNDADTKIRMIFPL